AWTFAICCASSYCGRSPVPKSPMAANFSEPGVLGSGEACAKSAAHATAATKRNVEKRRRSPEATRITQTIHRSCQRVWGRKGGKGGTARRAGRTGEDYRVSVQ